VNKETKGFVRIIRIYHDARSSECQIKDLFSLVYLHFPIITAEKISAVAQHWTHWHRLTATSQSWFNSLETMRHVGR